jgi:toxin-antitoxin system PIN domain toxin
MAALFDVNVWVALTFSGHKYHKPALEAFDSYMQKDAVLFNKETQRGYLTAISSPEVTEMFGQKSLSNLEAWNYYLQLLEDDRVNYIEDPEGLNDTWHATSLPPVPAPKLWLDAYIASFAMMTGLELVTFDKTFRQFSALSLVLLKPD